MTQSPLPIYDHQLAILDAVKNHRVVVIEGATGTGKTTQLPRILHHAGLSERVIGITQPRRIAAVSVAWRIAEEEKVTLGQEVGYAIRFDDCTSAKTRIKIMTDGILLQEARTDSDLSHYDILVIDEAHERSLNIDFALGLLHRILERRKDLKVIVSSATLEPGRFQRFFGKVAGDIPLVSIANRIHPVDILYKPLVVHEYEDMTSEITEHILYLHAQKKPGHILVFLPGEAIIRDVEQLLRSRYFGTDVTILPIFSRLTREEQERVFEEFPGTRKIVLATNIAETSITIPDVNFVVDLGLAKIPWFNAQNGITTLREETISQASAQQRAGRAGRTGPGTVIRLYDEASLKDAPLFTTEEILRSDLSESVLRLIDLGVHDVEKFPFPTPPPREKLHSALDALRALGAIDEQRRLTDIGRKMVPFPLSPSLARMVVEAAVKFPDAVYDVLIVASYLSVRSPYTFPPDEEFQARKVQSARAHTLGDAVTFVRVFEAWNKAKDKRAFCKTNFLDGDGMAFIQRAHGQLTEIAEELGIVVHKKSAEAEHIVRSVATGFADKVLIRRGYNYETPSGFRLSIHPSSALAGSHHQFLVAAELMKSGRAYAFNVSALQPQWLAEINPSAARQWQIKTHKKIKVDEGPSKPQFPESITLAGIELPVLVRQGKASIEIPSEAAGRLARVSFKDIPVTKDSQKWRAVVVTPQGPMLRGNIFEVIALLPFAPLAGDEPLKADVPLGALLEPDRNLHTLTRYLPRLLEPMRGVGNKSPGWLALASNSSGGYWYDVIMEYGDAVTTSLQAIEDLQDAGPETSDIMAVLDEREAHLEHALSAVEGALIQAHSFTKRR